MLLILYHAPTILKRWLNLPIIFFVEGANQFYIISNSYTPQFSLQKIFLRLKGKLLSRSIHQFLDSFFFDQLNNFLWNKPEFIEE